MALFVQCKVGSLPGQPVETAWRRGKGRTLLAVRFDSGDIRIYAETGNLEASRNLKVLGGGATCIAWHPSAPTLAIGWANGDVTVWKHAKGRAETYQSKTSDGGKILCVEWGDKGARLATGNAMGVATIWRVDAMSRIAPMAEVSLPGSKIEIVRACPFSVERSKADEAYHFFFEVQDKNRKTGEVITLSDAGKHSSVSKTDGPLVVISYVIAREVLVCLSTSGALLVLLQQPDATWLPVTSLVLTTSGGPSDGRLSAHMCTDDIVAFASTNDVSVRMYNLDTEENFLLPVQGSGKISSLSFDDKEGVLVAGTTTGYIAMWKCELQSVAEENQRDNKSVQESSSVKGMEEAWLALPKCMTTQSVTAMSISEGMRTMAVSSGSGIEVLRRCELSRSSCKTNTAVQFAPNYVAIQSIESANLQTLKVDFQVTNLRITDSHLMVWGTSEVNIFELGPDIVRVDMNEPIPDGASTAAEGGVKTKYSVCQREDIAAYGDSYFRIASNGVEVCNINGVVKQNLAYDAAYGNPSCVSVHHSYAVSSSTGGHVMIWRLGGREAKKVLPQPRRIEPSSGRTGKVLSVRCNCSGTKVSVLCESEKTSATDSRILVYDVESDSISEYAFNIGSVPENHVWDDEDPRLFACEIRSASEPDKTRQIWTLFATQDQGIMPQESITISLDESLLALYTPHVILYKGPPAISDNPENVLSRVKMRVLRDFTGMEDVDRDTKKALLSFSYNLATGNMDEARRAVKKVTNSNVWANMAKMCIKTKRLPFAEQCLGNMGHARGARAVRQTSNIPEEDARVGCAAIHLNMIDDALALFESCNRHDLSNRLYQASGNWEAALKVAEANDRIHIKNTHYTYARHLESCGNFVGAIKEYELAGTQTREVPRMLFDAGEIGSLEKYTVSNQNKELITWSARLAESEGEIEKALKLYTSINDTLSVVRLHCLTEDFASADTVIEESGEIAPAFFLARQYENHGRIPDAIRVYARSGRLSNAIRLAKQESMVNDVLSLALQATPMLMLEAAEWLEANGLFEHAVTLFQKAGKRSKALSLCFEQELFDSLRSMADELGSGDDPEILQRCGKFFLSHNQYEKAVHLYITAKEFAEALELCLSYNITISEDMAEKMTPEKGSLPEDERIDILKRVAKCCKRQGSYHLACKKYTQAGDKVKGMKALIKSGDKEKIIFFAQVSRQRDLFVMAANYLQTTDWHSNPDVMKSIVQFYTKARAMDSLSAFYQACAQLEVDEYRDYDKAVSALREATKALAKGGGIDKDTK